MDKEFHHVQCDGTECIMSRMADKNSDSIKNRLSFYFESTWKTKIEMEEEQYHFQITCFYCKFYKYDEEPDFT